VILPYAVYYSWPIPPPKSLPSLKDKGGISPTLPFAFGWLPESLCSPIPEDAAPGGMGVGGHGDDGKDVDEGFRLDH